MGRLTIPQKRLGRREAGQLGALIKRVREFRIFTDQRKLGETKITNHLINYLKQHLINFENRNIDTVRFVNETFRPEGLLRGSSNKYPLCAIECKKLDDDNAKSRWKEGLSQALLYGQRYKAVLYILFDYTSGAKYESAFGRGNRPESRLAKQLRNEMNLYVIALKPTEL
jgi:hypothetical protein